MQYNIGALNSFYDGKFGRLASKFIAKQLEQNWHNLQGLEILGYGYTRSILEYIANGNPKPNEPRRIIDYNFTKATPENYFLSDTFCPYGKNLTLIGEEANLPFPEASFDRIIVAHALEEAENPNRTLRELWRILRPEGKIVFIVPNRRGILAQIESTPFGQGRPYSKSQLSELLNASMFSITYAKRFLYTPPIKLILNDKSSNLIELLGENIMPHIGGLLFIEATKKIAIEPDRNLQKATLKSQASTAYSLSNNNGAMPKL